MLCCPNPQNTLTRRGRQPRPYALMLPNKLMLRMCEVLFIFSFLIGQMNVCSQLESISGIVRAWLVNSHFPPRKAAASLLSCCSFPLTSTAEAQRKSDTR